MSTNRNNLREDPRKPYEYVPPNEFDIPPSLKEAFLEKGFYLRWIRVFLDGKEDKKNIGERLREGYTFVQMDEVAEADPIFVAGVDESNLGRTGEILTVGDVALAKILIEKAEARKRFFEGRALQFEEAEDTKLMASNNRIMPIEIKKSSKISTGGRKQNFAPEEAEKSAE